MYSCILVLLLAGLPAQSQDRLREAVTVFWTHLAAGDKASALKYVLEDCQNAFIMRRDPVIRSWKIVSTDAKDDRTADVTIAVEGLFPGKSGILNTNQTQRWIANDDSWKLYVARSAMVEAAKKLTTPNKRPPLVGLRVSPKQLRIQFLDSFQTAGLYIENGGSSEAELLEVRYDAQRFEIVRRPEKVPAGQIGRLLVRYKGTEEAKDLTSEISLRVRHGGKEEVFRVAMLYNHISEGARALFGLTAEQARALRRGEKLTPVVPAPQSAPGPPIPTATP